MHKLELDTGVLVQWLKKARDGTHTILLAFP